MKEICSNCGYQVSPEDREKGWPYRRFHQLCPACYERLFNQPTHCRLCYATLSPTFVTHTSRDERYCVPCRMAPDFVWGMELDYSVAPAGPPRQ
jgi:hypothetical protein